MKYMYIDKVGGREFRSCANLYSKRVILHHCVLWIFRNRIEPVLNCTQWVPIKFVAVSTGAILLSTMDRSFAPFFIAAWMRNFSFYMTLVRNYSVQWTFATRCWDGRTEVEFPLCLIMHKRSYFAPITNENVTILTSARPLNSRK